MVVNTSYSVKIKTEYKKALKDTVKLYTDAVRFFIIIILQEWDNVKGLSSKQVVVLVEKLTHATSSRSVVKYPEFDKLFFKFPSYLRRAAIACAYGKCSSYKSNLANWECEDVNTRGRAPSAPRVRCESPVFYKGNMYRTTGDDYACEIKVFKDSDWKFITVKLKKSDVDYIRRNCSDETAKSPVLKKDYKVWKLAYCLTTNQKLSSTSLKNTRVLAVDLGINTACTCSVMNSEGTVLSRHFFTPTVEKDLLNHKLNKIKKAQQHGSRKTPGLWSLVNNVNTEIARKTAKFVSETAEKCNVDVIVFEYLDTKGKKKGSKKQKLHMWRKNTVQRIVNIHAHKIGIRVSHVCAYNTSRLAYDGSGKVARGAEASFSTYELCRFTTGKVYNCDLSASYNIGSRYFVREILKSFSEMKKLEVQAKVPELAKRSTCTLSSLIKLNAAA